MGNHSHDCRYCGSDLLREGHAAGCPGPRYEEAMRLYRRAQREHVETATALYRGWLASAEQIACADYEKQHPPPQEPRAYWEMVATGSGRR